MIAYLKGKLLYSTADTAVIEVGGVGYEVYCSASAFSKMTVGGVCEVYTYLQVSEQNGVTLYGFSSVEEKNMFLKLISVSGVGPKMGIAVLSSMDSSSLAAAIATRDLKRLTAVKGLGKKTAERIILELREKVGALPQTTSQDGVAPVVLPGEGDEDAIVALQTLGFSRAESAKAVAAAKAKGASGIEEIIMQALKGM